MSPSQPKPQTWAQRVSTTGTLVSILVAVVSGAGFIASNQFVSKDTFEAERRNTSAMSANIANLDKQMTLINAKLDKMIDIQLEQRAH